MPPTLVLHVRFWVASLLPLSEMLGALPKRSGFLFLHPLCLENRGLVFRNVCYKEIRECTLILSANNLPLGKQKDVSVGWRSGVPATPWLIVWTLWFNMGLTAPSEDKWQGWLSKWVMEWSSLGTGNDSLSLPKCFLCVNVVGMLN